ncbi:MAG: class I mannose-6-phosphate isomerase [Ruminococcaceae bacterium]|nr:class I mannose-6-phosphate isomerase [Oscillospiraceae bacterium]
MILKLKPVFKDYIWGGNKLKTDFGFDTGLDKTAEGWMLSCHKDGENTVENGGFEGKTLNEVIEICGREILGKNGRRFDFFPILIKLIDAKDNLSIQVHPDNDYALRVEGEYGKTECWYIIDCEENAELIYGFKRELTKDEFVKKIKDNTFLDAVNRVKVHKGDLFFIEAGTLHAIGKGILLCEIQQNSNTTYRVYDYNRKDKDGNTRPLHIEKAAEVTKCEMPKYGTKPSGKEIKTDGGSFRELVSCDLFKAARLALSGEMHFDCGNESFVSLLVLDGEGKIENADETLAFKKGDSFFISAGSGRISLSGNAEIIKTSV